MTDIEIHEREDDDRYEAWALVGGVRFSKVVYRSPIGWPNDYKHAAHAEIRSAVARVGCEAGVRQATTDVATR